MLKLEICCYSVEDAMIAESAGADRISLCSGRMEGGLTPSYGELVQARANLNVPVFPAVRPRGGDFYYSNREFESIKNDVALIKELGFSGMVFGMLDREGNVNMPQVKALIKIAGDMEITFSRAFDMCNQPDVALRQLTDLGVSRIFTSGQQQTAEVGLSIIERLLHSSEGPIIMPSGGVRMNNLHKFVDIGAKEIHSSACQSIKSEMRYRKVGVSIMNNDHECDEFIRVKVDSDLVAIMKDMLLLYSPLGISVSA